MSKRSQLLPALPVILATLLLAACGGGTSTGSAAPSANGTPAAANEAAPAADTAAADQAADPAVTSARVASDDAQPAPSAANGTETPSPTSKRFNLGTNYIRLSPTQPTSSSPTQIEVAEIFWYGCPHCYNFEAYLKKWLETKPSYVNFIRIPAVWNPRLKLHARAFYTAQALGKGDAMHDAFFKEIHVNQNLLDTEDKLVEFFGRFGVDKATFEKAFKSYAVQEKMQRADELNRRYRIMNVPSMVVNGKYMTNGAMAGSYQGMLDLVDELVASEKAAEQ